MANGAGRSAREQAARQRAKAQRLLASAERWDRGAEGERATAAVLRGLSPAFTVLHDLAIPGSRANIDHLVIGPTGVFLVDSKNHRGHLRLSDGTLWQGRRPLRREVETAAWEAERAGAAIGFPVYPIVCFVAATLPAPFIDIDPVRIVGLDGLLPAIHAGRADMSFEATSRLVLNAQRALPPHGTQTSAPPVPPRAAAPTARGGRQPRRRRRLRLRELFVSVVGGLVAMVAAVTILPRALSDVADNLTPKPAAPAINGTFSCPALGAGWSLLVAFPGTAYGTNTYRLEWAEEGSSEWLPLLEQRRPTDPQLPIAGRQPGSRTQVRGRATTAAGTAGEIGAGTFTAPADPC